MEQPLCHVQVSNFKSYFTVERVKGVKNLNSIPLRQYRDSLRELSRKWGVRENYIDRATLSAEEGSPFLFTTGFRRSRMVSESDPAPVRIDPFSRRSALAVFCPPVARSVRSRPRIARDRLFRSE